MKEIILKNRNLINIIVIILVSIFLSIPLLNKNLNVYVDDGIQHISRAYGTYLSIKDNKSIPNVISSFSNGFGYSWNLFYGPLSTFGIIIIKLFTSNFITAYKIFVFLCLILSGYFMYKFIYNYIGNYDVALLSAILYISFPYHLTDLYIRHALGEYVSFVFIPLVFLGLYNILYTSSKHYYLTIGAVGLLVTHNLSTIIVLFFSALYIGLNIEKINKTNVKKSLIVNIIFILTISCFYWMPLLETKIFCKYQVYEPGMMATRESVQDKGLKITQLFVSKNDGSFVFELGPHIIVMLAVSIMAIRLMDDEIKETYVFCLISGIISIWMSTKYFPWKLLPEEISIIQFPWRMMIMASFFFSITCSINAYVLVKKFDYKDVIIISCIAVFYTVAFRGYLLYDENLANIENITLGRISGKESEAIAGLGKEEYLPVKAYQNRFYIATRDDYIDILEGSAIIQNEIKKGTHYTADIKVEGENYTILELPYIYYPGYEVRLDGMITDTFETKNGFIGFVMGKNDNAKLEVNYVGTKIMNVSIIISSISLIIFGVYVWKKH